ncbi:MAG: flagellar motor protein MotB [Sulfurimicrobium sp.]|jgi:chemotaxis protein MotB|nr:flagellar motor protein MotB [Sulfurimicrobium sp.]MDP1703243.1 flagellar motor protein MotB [Sulfurimicrobium sp.]MDP2200109.1 flagellar motor protein MotB [Sulfurimicrobium sp.]MDP2963217.1 flagellar motor protein MotB [Sulfurimicrobium sp.]MDP3687459.1 flagellar motor protein MotB [Sulfurimicrobium sp.]
MSDDSQRPIVIKKIKKGGHGHHGGAWKIAYADFVTAMMAFFLLMWLLGSTAKGDMEGIAEYFKTPLKVALQGGSGSGDASSVIKGGGTDISRKDGQVKKGTPEPIKKKTINLEAAKAELKRQEEMKLAGLKERLEKTIESNPLLKQFKKQLMLDITKEGLRIQIVDEKNRPMFDSGGAHLKPYTQVILREIGKVLNEVDNRITLSGHTDATPYSGGDKGYSNWELSADRANASRRELVAGGMEDGKMLRVVGLSSAVPFDLAKPDSPVNRRISIIVMNKEAEEAVTKADKVELEVASKADVASTLQNHPKEEAAGATPAPTKH